MTWWTPFRNSSKFIFRIQLRTTQDEGDSGSSQQKYQNVLQKIDWTYRDWHEKLLFALLTYWTSSPSSAGATSFFLVYVMEAVFPIEVQIRTLWILMEIELEEAKWALFDQLSFIRKSLVLPEAHCSCLWQEGEAQNFLGGRPKF